MLEDTGGNEVGRGEFLGGGGRRDPRLPRGRRAALPGPVIKVEREVELFFKMKTESGVIKSPKDFGAVADASPLSSVGASLMERPLFFFFALSLSRQCLRWTLQ